MPEVFADFNRLEEWPGVGRVIPLGSLTRHPELAALEGQTVILTDRLDLRAQGRITQIDDWWFGVLTSPIEDIPESSLKAG